MSGEVQSETPIAFLVLSVNKIKQLQKRFSSTIDRLIELVPQVVDDIQSNLIKKGQEKEKNKEIVQ